MTTRKTCKRWRSFWSWTTESDEFVKQNSQNFKKNFSEWYLFMKNLKNTNKQKNPAIRWTREMMKLNEASNEGRDPSAHTEETEELEVEEILTTLERFVKSLLFVFLCFFGCFWFDLSKISLLWLFKQKLFLLQRSRKKRNQRTSTSRKQKKEADKRIAEVERRIIESQKKEKEEE